MKRTGAEESTLLEVVLQVHSELRKTLDPLRVTPLQAGVLLVLSRHSETNLGDAAARLRVRSATLSEVVNDLVRKRWVTKHRSVTDTRAVCLSLSRKGKALAPRIEQRVRQVEAILSRPDPATTGMHLNGRA
jgi:DNA-binding MarR family transcriptional regulator